MDQYEQIPPVIDPSAAASVKWGGLGIVFVFLFFLAVFFGIGVALLAVGACFGTFMFCVGLEAQDNIETRNGDRG